MQPAVECQKIPDRLGGYHPYTVAYRAEGSDRYRDFSPRDPFDPAAWIETARTLDWRGDRCALVSALGEGLERLDAPPAARAAAAALGEENTFLVVAGHQPALFGGPLFLALKLASILRVCDDLNARQDGVRFVPLFWNGSEEHNLAEFGRATLFDREHDQVHLRLPGREDRRMAAATPADEARSLLPALRDALPETEFRDSLLERLDACLCEDLGASVSRLVLDWFGDRGLVVAEPRWLRAAAGDVLARALREPEALHACLEEDSEAMRAAGFEPPLPYRDPERTLVFRLEDGRRDRIRIEDGCFRFEASGRTEDRDALLDECAAHPERFGPSAALRPVVQCAVMPVAGYVAGGGELAYHFQLRRLFARKEVPMPLLLPRAAGTVLKASLGKTMRRIGLSVEDLLSPGWEWETVEAASDARGAGQRRAFGAFSEAVRAAKGDLGRALREHGVENLNELDREVGRFLDRVEGLREGFRRKDPAVGEGPRRQYYRLRKFVLPGEGYQELSAWTVYFLALYGPGFLPALLEHVDPWTARHHVFTVR